MWQFKGRFFSVFMLWVAWMACYANDGCGEAERSFPCWRIATDVHTGFVINHRSNMYVLSERRPYAGEVFLTRQTHGEKEWHSFFGYPEYGASLMMFDFGSPTYIGKGHGLYSFMNFFLLDNGKRFNLTIKAGGGVAYVEKIFDRHTNYKNIAVSSHINALLRLQLNAHVRITDKWSACTGFGLTHFSNGTFKKPNAGLNIITLNAGLGYAFGGSYSLKSPTTIEALDKKWSYRMYLSGGIKEILPIGGDKFLASGLSFEFSRRHRPFTRLSGTIDVFYDSSDYVSLQNDNVSRLQTMKAGVAAGYDLIFGKLSAIAQMGVYLYAKYTEYGYTYQRLAIRYAVTSKVNIHFGLKTHLGQADYIELACGYKIR